MHELFEKMRNHRVNIDGNVSTVLFTTLVLEVSFKYLIFLWNKAFIFVIKAMLYRGFVHIIPRFLSYVLRVGNGNWIQDMI